MHLHVPQFELIKSCFGCLVLVYRSFICCLGAAFAPCFFWPFDFISVVYSMFVGSHARQRHSAHTIHWVHGMSDTVLFPLPSTTASHRCHHYLPCIQIYKYMYIIFYFRAVIRFFNWWLDAAQPALCGAQPPWSRTIQLWRCSIGLSSFLVLCFRTYCQLTRFLVMPHWVCACIHQSFMNSICPILVSHWITHIHRAPISALLTMAMI